METVTQIPIFC